MPISSTERKAGPFYGNGVATTFTFDFKIFEPSELRVVRYAADLAVDVDLTAGIDFNISLNPDQDEAPGGVVILARALAENDRLVLLSDVPDLQPVDITNQGGFYPELVNNGLDRSVIQVQQLREKVGRAIKLPPTAEDGDYVLPVPQGNQLLAWGQDGKTITNLDPGELISVVTYGNTKADRFDGDGVSTVFALTASPGSVNNLAVSIDGVVQVPEDDYSWGGGKVLSFVVPPPAGTKIFVRYQEALDEGSDVSGKLDRSGVNSEPNIMANLPVEPTSPSVMDEVVAANVILDKPLIPERMARASDNLPAILEGLADATDLLQRMADASQQDERDKMKPLELGACRMVLEGRVTALMGNYGGSGLNLRGGGNNVTKLIAHPDNAEGLVKIVRSHNMERVAVSGVSFISRLLQQTDNPVMNGMDPGYATADLDKHNGVALWIAGPTPGVGIYGLEDDTSVIVEQCSWHGEGANASQTLYNGVWKRALQIDGAWFAIVQDNHFAGLGDFNSGMTFHGEINEYAALLNHCYAPEFAGNKINGTWTTGFELKGLEAGADISSKFDQRWEGGRVRHNIFGGFSKTAVRLSHNFGRGTLQAPGFQILDNHINFRVFGVEINGHRQIEATSNEFYANSTADPWGETLPAAYLLRDCGDFDSVNDAFLELGWYGDDDHAFVCYRLEDKVQGFKSSAARFNCAGIGVRISPDAPPPPAGDMTGTTRSIQVLDAAIGGRRAFNLWTDPFKPFVDRTALGVVYWEGTEQDALGDRKRFVSNLKDPTNTLSSPIVNIDRARDDFATNSAPKLGYEAQRFQDSSGAWREASVFEATVDDNTAGSPKTGFKLWAWLAGAFTDIISVSGALGQMAFNIGQVIHTATTALANNRPRYELFRARPDHATVANGKLGEYSFAGLNAAGTKKLTGGLANEFVDNAAGAERTVNRLYGLENGALVQPIVTDGNRAIVQELWTGSVVLESGLGPVGYVVLHDTFGNSYKVMVTV